MKEHIGFHYLLQNTDVYFDSFAVEYIQHKVLGKIKDKFITHNIFRRKGDDSIMCRCFCIALWQHMLTGNILLHYSNLFSPNDFKKNDKRIYKFFKDKYDKAWLLDQKKWIKQEIISQEN